MFNIFKIFSRVKQTNIVAGGRIVKGDIVTDGDVEGGKARKVSQKNITAGGDVAGGSIRK